MAKPSSELDIVSVIGPKKGSLNFLSAIGTDFKLAKRPGPETITSWNHWDLSESRRNTVKRTS